METEHLNQQGLPLVVQSLSGRAPVNTCFRSVEML